MPRNFVNSNSPDPAFLAALGRNDLHDAARRAKHDAEVAATTARLLESWSERLAPYFDREPQLTVACALARYEADRGRSSAMQPNG